MLNDTMVTLQGYVGGDVELRQVGDSVVANLRVAATPRKYQRRSEEWSDGETQWYSVSAWRHLGEHCARSLRRGDPVVVHGRLLLRTYVNKAGIEVTALEIDALLVGHDLTRGISSFSKRPVAAPAPVVQPAPAPADPGDAATGDSEDGGAGSAAA